MRRCGRQVFFDRDPGVPLLLGVLVRVLVAAVAQEWCFRTLSAELGCLLTFAKVARRDSLFRCAATGSPHHHHVQQQLVDWSRGQRLAVYTRCWDVLHWFFPLPLPLSLLLRIRFCRSRASFADAAYAWEYHRLLVIRAASRSVRLVTRRTLTLCHWR